MGSFPVNCEHFLKGGNIEYRNIEIIGNINSICTIQPTFPLSGGGNISWKSTYQCIYLSKAS